MLEQLIKDYGYLALFIGTFLEGETILIIAGVAASEGLLDIRWAMLSAFLGSVSGDQVYFLLGRFRGEWLLAKMPRWKVSLNRALQLLERHCVWVILTYRYMYGIRNITSFAVGVSRTRSWLFVPLNLLGGAIWAVGFGLGGYAFGSALLLLSKDVRRYQIHILAAVCTAALLIWILRMWRRKQRFAEVKQNRLLATLMRRRRKADLASTSQSLVPTPDDNSSSSKRKAAK